MLFTAIAAFLLFILITRIAFTVINGDHDRRRTNHDDFSKVINPKKTEKTSSSSSKRKGKKKVRFAVDHDDEFVVNKVVAGPSETAKLVVFEKDQYDEKELISLNDVVDCDQAEEEAKIESISEENVGNHDHDDDDGGGLIGVKLVCDDDGVDEELKEKEGLISDEDDDSDDWEGVERSDLEKVFAMAAEFGKVDDNLGDLESDVQMQLYGLHKVATEGPCYEAQPMALKVSAKAKWNAWQKLGNMNPDVAMEQYIALLSEKVPGWSQGIHHVGTDVPTSIMTSIVDTSQKERKREIESCSAVADLSGVSDSVDKDKQ